MMKPFVPLFVLAPVLFVVGPCSAVNVTTKEYSCCALPQILIDRRWENQFYVRNITHARVTETVTVVHQPFVFKEDKMMVQTCVDFDQKTVFYLENGLLDENFTHYRGRLCERSGSSAVHSQGRGCTALLGLLLGLLTVKLSLEAAATGSTPHPSL